MNLKKIRVGIIGTGFGYKVVYNSLKKNKNLKIIGFANKNKKIKLPKKFIYFKDWKAMISSDKIDAVFIASPPYTHKDIIIYALNKNKHIFCEKPCTTSLKDISYIAKRFKKKKNLSFMVNYEFIEIQAFKFFKKIILEKKINKKNIHLVWNIKSKNKKNNWKTNSRLGGGIIFNFACHTLHYVEHLFGRIIYIKSKIITNKKFQSLNANLFFKKRLNLKMKMRIDYENKKFIPSHSIDLLVGKNRYKLDSKAANLQDQFIVEKFNEGNKRKILFGKKSSKIDFRIDPIYKNSLKFSNWIQSNKTNRPNIYDAQRVHYLISKVIKSSKQKKIIKI